MVFFFLDAGVNNSLLTPIHWGPSHKHRGWTAASLCTNGININILSLGVKGHECLEVNSQFKMTSRGRNSCRSSSRSISSPTWMFLFEHLTITQWVRLSCLSANRTSFWSISIPEAVRQKQYNQKLQKYEVNWFYRHSDFRGQKLARYKQSQI